MRSEGKNKHNLAVSVPAAIVIVLALVVIITITAFLLWVMYGNDKDKGKEENASTGTGTEQVETAKLDVSADWSIPKKAFRGGNGSGRFVQKRVKNNIDTQMLFENMGVDEETATGKEKQRVNAVKRFIKGLYYDADVDRDLSNGDTIIVTIKSKENEVETEKAAGIEIEGVGASKEVTVSGLAEKLTVNDMYSRSDLLQAAKETAEEVIRNSEEGDLKEIFGNESRYNVSFQYYGTYFAKAENDDADDALIVLYRLSSTYPDSGYYAWNSDGDYVNTYQMTHFSGVNKDTSVSDIESGMKYDSFRYENEANDVLEYYRQNLDPSSTYTVQQIG